MKIRNDKGMTFLGVIIALSLAGLAIGWGITFLRPSADRDLRNPTVDALDEARKTLFIYTRVNGKLPVAEAGSALPASVLGVIPQDGWGRGWRYVANAGLLTRRFETCSNLKTVPPLTGFPEVLVWDGEAGASLPVAFVLVSAGPRDADGQKDGFDAVGEGDNTDGPTYARATPTESFDDLTVYVSADQLYGWLKNPALVSQTEFNWTTCIAPHCVPPDAVMNYDEEGVNCGGNDCAPCPPPVKT